MDSDDEMNLLIRSLLFLWQLPQNIAGLGLLAFAKLARMHKGTTDGVHVLRRFWAGGVCLGEFVFVHEYCDRDDVRRHELGHRRQSRMLGPLYLLVVGIPSAILCTAARFSPYISRTYDDHFPENWANRLGGVAGPDKPASSACKSPTTAKL